MTETSFVIRETNVFDETGSFSGPLDVRVEDGIVREVGRHLVARDLPSLDWSGTWLLPGFFDCHDHLALSTIDALEALKTPLSRWALETARNARVTLEAGVTFVRDAAGLDLGVKQSIDTGIAPGPRTQLSITALCQTGGHVDGFLTGLGLEISAEYVLPEYPGRPPYRVNGVEEMRQAVRELLRAGADWIKLCTTGGIVSEHDLPEQPEFTFDEIAVAVAEASTRGKSVMTHAYGGPGLDNAINAGVRSIEHGTFLTEAQASAMAAAGCWLVPTLSVLWACVRWAKEGALPPYAVEKALGFEPTLGDAVAIAREYGVRVAAGSDYIERTQHGGNLEEIAHLHRAGLTLEEALLAATTHAAELCGVAGQLGRIAPGYIFDAVRLDEDPSDVSIFERPGAVAQVFKAGEPVVQHPREERALA
jgi:imidazolonepropionase-like amidohydrolase